MASSSSVSNLFPASTNALDQASTDDAVFSVIFGHSREQNVVEGTPEGQPGSLSSSKDFQESALELAQESLQDIEDAEVGENTSSLFFFTFVLVENEIFI